MSAKQWPMEDSVFRILGFQWVKLGICPYPPGTLEHTKGERYSKPPARGTCLATGLLLRRFLALAAVGMVCSKSPL